jgi:hypothetical protein
MIVAEGDVDKLTLFADHLTAHCVPPTWATFEDERKTPRPSSPRDHC